MPNAYDKTYMDGNLVDEFMAQSLRRCEKTLGYELTIIQGSYNAGGVSASAGTHDGGGAVDLSAYDWQRKVKVLRRNGWAAWHRPAIAGLWGEHIHAIQYDNKRLSSGAQTQVWEYMNGYDGLAGSGRDPHRRPSPVPHFHYNDKPAKPKTYGDPVNRARVNRSLKHHGKYRGESAMNDMKVVVRHIRNETDFSVEGFGKTPEGSLERALTRINGNGRLDRKTARKLRIKSKWSPLPSWGNKGGKHKR